MSVDNPQSPIHKALAKLDYAIGHLEAAIDADQEAKRRQADLFQQLQEQQKANNTPSIDKDSIVKTLEKSIETIETVLKRAS